MALKRGGATYNVIGGLSNVVVVAHDGGHEFPQAEVLEFMKRTG